ncbi:Nucleotidyl transferase [Arachidicoccus rhizosphaerae]|uniref:Nucleotidyl transferase n=1 Tax=Arachidicoccus rhizosphaerae TaxID=551991 RepID=A0A1H4BP23_9BACT|nr:sugar phosphate nucleotidyltransferase [Arachidicoccus rhizosphaerae]SEA49838.1 Nucleotidyl transferase [Arachidicoccus rhizosphaerae]
MKALILAAGLGTRLKPWTLHHPKALAEVNGRSLLQRTIEYLQKAGIQDVIVNVHHFADQIVQCLQDNQGWGSHYVISDETSRLMDTGGAVMQAAAAGYLADTDQFLIVNADILTDLSLNALIKEQVSSRHLATLAVSDRASSRRLLFEKQNGLLAGWENMTTGEQKITRQTVGYIPKAFSGIHCMNSKIIQLLSEIPEFNGQMPFSIIDAYLALSKTEAVGFYDHTGSLFMDTGTPERLVEAAAVFR